MSMKPIDVTAEAWQDEETGRVVIKVETKDSHDFRDMIGVVQRGKDVATVEFYPHSYETFMEMVRQYQ